MQLTKAALGAAFVVYGLDEQTGLAENSLCEAIGQKEPANSCEYCGVDGSEDLRAALQRRNDKNDAAAKRQADLDVRREAYEQEEEAARYRLHEAAAALLKALLESGTAEEIPIGYQPHGLGKLFRSRARVLGWDIQLGANTRVLSTDGSFVFASFPDNWILKYEPLNEWIDQQIEGVRTEFGANAPRYIFGEAFRDGVRPSGSREGTESELRDRLSSKISAIIQMFAEVLHERGVAI